jgi:hypothetical protein
MSPTCEIKGRIVFRHSVRRFSSVFSNIYFPFVFCYLHPCKLCNVRTLSVDSVVHLSVIPYVSISYIT